MTGNCFLPNPERQEFTTFLERVRCSRCGLMAPVVIGDVSGMAADGIARLAEQRASESCPYVDSPQINTFFEYLEHYPVKVGFFDGKEAPA